MKRVSFFTIIYIVTATVIQASNSFLFNGLWYGYTNDTQVRVIAQSTNQSNYDNLSGAISIPTSVRDGRGGAYTVTAIDQYAFRHCTGITSVTIPTSVSSIGEGAFENCSGLTSVTIPNSVTSIGKSAFNECGELTSVTIPNTITSIRESTFRKCTNLENVTIPNSVTSIGNYAFAICSSLASVTIPESVTTISKNAFANCGGLASIVVLNGNTTYDSRNNCNAIIETATNTLIAGCKNTIIPNSVTTIGDYAFYGCRGLTSASIPNSVTSIGNSAFYGCSGLTSFTIPNSVTSIGNSAFYGCSGLTSVTISSSISSIGRNAFSECSELINLYWNAKVCADFETTATAFDHPFKDCTSLTRVTIGAEVESLPSYFMYGISSLRELILGDTSAKISNYAFSGCSGLTSVTIPNSITSIGGSAFRNCSGLTSITIGNSVTTIGGSAFRDCSGLTSVTIPNSVTSIGWAAFTGCSGLTSVTIGNSVTSIGSDAFYNCSSLTSVTIPNSVTSIGDNAFNNCSSLTSVKLSNRISSVQLGIFENCINLTDITIPASVSLIAREAFYGCSSLRSIEIPASVSSIGREAFCGCKVLTSIALPSSINQLGNNIFDSTLKELIVYWKEPISISNDVFTKCYESTRLRVPNGTVSYYQTLTGWNSFKNISGNAPQEAPKTMVTNISLNSEELSLWPSYTQKLIATVMPDNANGIVRWTSDDEAVATVDSNGLVTAIAPGNTIIYAVATDGSDVISPCHIEVVEKPLYTITSTPLNIIRGKNDSFELVLSLENENPITSIQFDMILSPQISLAYINGVADVWLDDARKARNHMVYVDHIYNDIYKVEISSPTSRAFSGNEGALLHMRFEPNYNAGNNSGNIVFQNIIAFEQDLITSHTIGDTHTTVTIGFIDGDADGDAEVDIADYVSTAAHLLSREVIQFWEDAADVNHDGSISFADLMGITNIALNYWPTREQVPDAIRNFNQIERNNSESSQNEDRVYVDVPDSFTPNQPFEMQLILNNTSSFCGLQTDIYLPEGLTVETEDDEFIIDPTNRCARTHSLTAVRINGKNAIRIWLSSQQLRDFSGNEGPIATISATTSADFIVPAEVRLSNSIASAANGEKHRFPDETLTIGGNWLKGDINDDGSVDGNDVSIMLEMVLAGGVTEAQLAVADINGDTSVDGNDVSILLEIVLSGE